MEGKKKLPDSSPRPRVPLPQGPGSTKSGPHQIVLIIYRKGILHIKLNLNGKY